MKMKTLLYLFIAALSVALLHAEDIPASEKKACCSKAELPTANADAPNLSDKSLYQVESTWTNDAGKGVRLSQLRGKPQLITMFFASCLYACPILVNDVQRIEEALPKALQGKVGVTLVSFDTERDTPPVLKRFRGERQVPSHWELLSGGSDDVLELAALLGVKYRKDANGQFAHSNIITLLNSEGEIVHQQVGLNGSVDELIRVLRTLNLDAQSTEKAKL